MKHIKQLDAIRAIAVLLVLVWHGFPLSHIINRVPNGPVGVSMFFVLSGFLITRILMEDRLQAETLGVTRLQVFKNFFFRRALRIFPIYYLLIFVLWRIEAIGTANIEYFLTYTSNFYFFQRQAWDGVLSHTWSLSIEEQFYLVWPWLMLFVKRRWLLPLILSCIGVGVVSLYLEKSDFGEVLPHTCLQAFGAGAFLSWIMVFKPRLLPKVAKALGWLAVAALLIFVMEVVTGNWAFVPVRTLVSAMTGWLIAFVLYKPGRLPVLNNRVLIFIGKISYGVYLFHPVIPHYSVDILTRINRHIPVIGNHILFLEQCALVIGVAWLSWRLIEQPILKLKKYFVLPPPKPVKVKQETVEEVAA